MSGTRGRTARPWRRWRLLCGEFGWRQPIVVDEAMMILAGHTRLEAARQLGLATVPVHLARGLTPAQAR